MSIVHARLSISPSGHGYAASASTRIETDTVPLSVEGSHIIISSVILIVLTALWTCMRIWCVKQSGRGFVIEDGLSIAAVILFYGLIATDFVMVFSGGLGYHVNELQEWHLVRLLKAVYAHQFLYVASLGLVKISVILMFMRIFFAGRCQFAAIAIMALTIAWMFLAILVELLLCHPVRMNWNLQPPDGTCGDHKASFAAVGIVDVVNQLAILMLPVPMILRLEMQMRYRVLIVCIFAVSFLTLIFGAIRLYTALQIEFNDLSYTAVQTTIYGAGEVGIAIIISSCPLLRPLFDKVFSTSTSGNSIWDKGGTEASISSRNRKTARSSGFTQMNESQDNLELGNIGAHRNKRNTIVTAGRRPPSTDDEDDSSIHRIVVVSETIVSRDQGNL